MSNHVDITEETDLAKETPQPPSPETQPGSSVEDHHQEALRNRGDHSNYQGNTGSFVASKSEVFYSWEDVEFSVPLKKGEKALLQAPKIQPLSSTDLKKLDKAALRLEVLKKSAQPKIYTDPKDPSKKQILHSVTGYARPKEMLAIMGASGSGKTSLLNILGQRLDLSRGSKVNGEILCNGRRVNKGDFGKLGAFVMQDDILIETMTPFESFCFAARLRTSLSGSGILKKANQMIDRLQLGACKNTKIGGFNLKSISGGERKRTSIGYELITDPRLILLDEPTSGLDSSTALRIISMLKKEVEQGMTVIATIHQPSGDIFNQFDRLIVLQDGFQIYQGAIKSLGGFIDKFGCTLGKFQNPADFIIKFAQAPELMNVEITFDKLKTTFETEQRAVVQKQLLKDQSKCLEVSMNFNQFAEDRKVGMCTQFAQVFKRNWQYLLRNPASLNGILFNGLFTAILNLILYWQVGNMDGIDFTDPASVMAWLYNLKGLAFLFANNIAFSTSMSVILQMPLQVPVFKRETANNMYSSTVYFWGRFLSNAILQLFYPITSILFVFYGLDIDQSFSNLVMFIFYAVALNLSMVAQGYFCGVLSDSEEVSKQVNTFIILLSMLTSGGLGNADAFPAYIMWVSKISPQRYACEGFYKCLTKHIPEPGRDYARNVFGFNKFTDAQCMGIIFGMFGAFSVAAWIIIVIRNRN